MRKLLLAFSVGFVLSGCTELEQLAEEELSAEETQEIAAPKTQTPGIPTPDTLPLTRDYVIINDNIPEFSNEALQTTEPFTAFEPLDELGRTGTAIGYLTPELMPAKDRSDISDIQPTGWNQNNYDFITNGGWLYNRSHLIGHQLTGEDNPENILTGTRQFNAEGMLPIENYVADYIETTENPVLYRVTPHYQGDNLLSHGVQMEAYSPRDDGVIEFNVFVPNQQDDVRIDYQTGENTQSPA